MRLNTIAVSLFFTALSLSSFAAPNNYKTHVVKWGETFYSVARTYKMDRGDLQKINSLVDLNLKEGQVLKVILPEEEAIIATPTVESVPATNHLATEVKSTPKATNDYESIFYQYIYSGMRKQIEAGSLAVDASIQSNAVYYNHAPVGSIVKLVNKENNTIVYAKVIGRLADAEKDQATLKVSETVAKAIFYSDKSPLEIASYSEE
jgi:LysM repeat protein